MLRSAVKDCRVEVLPFVVASTGCGMSNAADGGLSKTLQSDTAEPVRSD